MVKSNMSQKQEHLSKNQKIVLDMIEKSNQPMKRPMPNKRSAV